MKRMRRLLTLCLAWLLVCGLVPLTAAEEVAIQVGDYLYLGVDESGASILWRCVAMREDGPLLVSHRVISYKAFDANTAGNASTLKDVNDPVAIRARYGSNNWKTSTLRQWLNSTGQVSWTGRVPDSSHVLGNAYAGQDGFLSGFTAAELAAVKTVTNTTAIGEVDRPDAGTAPHVYSLDWQMTAMLQNYSTAYVQYTQDRFFLLNTPEVIALSQNLGNNYEVASPTAYAAALCEPKYIDDVGATYYWLRDAYAEDMFPEGVRCMYPSGHEYYYSAYNGNIGVRPAFVLAQTVFSYGSGSLNDPYSLQGQVFTASKDAVAAQPQEKKPYIGTAGVAEMQGASASLAIGDYVEMGELDGKAILWRCVDIDQNGPLLLSDKILRMYAFDAMGAHANDPTGIREENGSNRWSTSSLRHWLNSDLPTWGNWDGVTVPSRDNLLYGYSAYAETAGFLTAFSDEELGMIREVENESLLNTLDIGEADSGSEVERLRRKLALLENYGVAYKEKTTDKVFLMNRVQANTVYTLFEDYIMAFSTDGAIRNSGYQNFAVSTGKTWHYWLRDAFGSAEYGYFTYDITTDGRISSDIACDPRYGVRPAFYLDMNRLELEAGLGTAEQPYVVKAHDFGSQEELIPPSCDHAGKAQRVCGSCGEVHTYTLEALGHDHQVTVTAEGLFFHEKTVRRCTRCDSVYAVGGKAKPAFALMLVAVAVTVTVLAVLGIKMQKGTKRR